MVHENVKNLKLEVPLIETTPTLRDAVTRRVQWRRTLIDIDPVAALASTSTVVILPQTRLELPNQPCHCHVHLGI
jgi:hypothetical protein